MDLSERRHRATDIAGRRGPRCRPARQTDRSCALESGVGDLAAHGRPRRRARRSIATGGCVASAMRLRDAPSCDLSINAYRLLHGEGDACPSLICDRYDRWLVVQLMSAGLEAFRDIIVDVLVEIAKPDGILARNDVALRGKEQLPVGTELLWGTVPQEIEINEHGIRMLAAPWRGQKTGAFLDQRENRVLIGERARGRALDCFSYHGSFALHLARRADTVVALDVSADALQRAGENCALNGITNVEMVVADTFDYLRERQTAGDVFDTIVLDPPAFAKTRASLPAAIRGYKDINLRAMRLLSRNGLLFTASCSFHLTQAVVSRDAARRRGRFGPAHRDQGDHRPAARPSGGRDDSGDRLSQGRATGGSRLALRVGRGQWSSRAKRRIWTAVKETASREAV